MAYLQFNPSDFLSVGSIDVSSYIADIKALSVKAELAAPTIDIGLIDSLIDLVGLKYEAVEKAKNVYDKLDDALNAAGSANASSVGGLVEAFSAVDTSEAEESVDTTIQAIRDVSRTIKDISLDSPTLGLYFAAAVSEKARSEIRDGLFDLQVLQSKLGNVQADLESATIKMSAFADRASTASKVALDLAENMLDLVAFAGPFALIFKERAESLIAAHIVLDELSRSASNASSLAKATGADVAAIAKAAASNATAFEVALSAPLAQSHFVTSADIMGEDSAYFHAAFTNNSFSRAGADSPGSFVVGALSISNFVTPGSGSPTFTGQITFRVDQSVAYPGAKDVTFSGAIATGFTYVSTLNIPNNPQASADGFYLPLLDVSLAVLENTTATFAILGSVNSPFKISAAVALDANGFVSKSDYFKPAASAGTDEALSGGVGNDSLFGGNGNDTLLGGVGADVLNGGRGKDTASYLTAASSVDADLEKAWKNKGEAAGDVYVGIENVQGSRHDDRIWGDSAENVITGGPGRDLLYGRDGADIFVFKAGDSGLYSANRDVVMDFQNGIDRIDLSSLSAFEIHQMGDKAQIRVDAEGDGVFEMQIAIRFAVGNSYAGFGPDDILN